MYVFICILKVYRHIRIYVCILTYLYTKRMINMCMIHVGPRRRWLSVEEAGMHLQAQVVHAAEQVAGEP